MIFDEDYINEEHIEAFSKALAWEEENDELGESADAHSAAQALKNTDVASNGAYLHPVKRPDLISSRSDWYPLTVDKPHKARLLRAKAINNSAKLKGAEPVKVVKKLRDEFRKSITYSLLRWPILIFVSIWIIILCAWYAIVRLYVALGEYYFTWVGERNILRIKLRNSKSYEEWIENAIALDKYLTLDKWSINPKFSYYDYKTVKLTTSKLQTFRLAGDHHDLLVILQGCLKKNFAGIENEQLYSHRYYGTKHLLTKYIDEVVKCIDTITESTIVDNVTKRRFFRIVLKNYGKSALCLSGGACFAYTHFGLVKGLLDNDLLPSIISGTSGGALIAALTCCRTDEELKKLIVPELARKITACEDPWYVWIPRLWKTGARFDSVSWARKSNFFTGGSLTFEESYKRTGRKLNVSTVPSDPHSPVILCNNITSPNCIIWSALLALSAVPGILNPVVLMMKENNKITPFSLGSKWRDGSLRTDIPVDALNTYYNVTFPIVAQVNPHISLFFYAPKGAVGRPVAIPSSKTHKETYEYLRGGFVATALEQLFKLEIRKWLTIIKTLDLLPHFLELDWLNLWLQKFSGAVTIWPRHKLRDFRYILSDPTEERLKDMISTGERSIYPKLLFIKHRLSIERAVERGIRRSRLPKGFSITSEDENTQDEGHSSERETQDEGHSSDLLYDAPSSDTNFGYEESSSSLEDF